jgi:hypothetical protein
MELSIRERPAKSVRFQKSGVSLILEKISLRFSTFRIS